MNLIPVCGMDSNDSKWGVLQGGSHEHVFHKSQIYFG
jgi:hypothetical protein